MKNQKKAIAVASRRHGNKIQENLHKNLMQV